MIFQKVAGELDPAGFIALAVKFKLQPWPIHATEYSEEVKSLQLDSFKIALVCFGHIISTADLLKIALQKSG